MAITGQVWKTTMSKNSPNCFYRIQIDGIKGVREENRVEKLMTSFGWEDAGHAFNTQTQETKLFFSKDFGDVSNFLSWGKSFQEFPLVEMDKNGEIKKYVKIGPRNASRGSQRICSKCGIRGHNARTCGTERSTKSAKAGMRKCGKCGQRGHNARTCKNKTSIINSIKSEVQQKTKSKRQCSKCLKYGHNARTCGKVVKPISASGYRCGSCGETGHNARRCPNK